MNPWGLEGFRVERVWEDALRILGEVGMRVSHPRALRAAREHLRLEGNTARFPAELVERCAEGIRNRAAGPPPSPQPRRLELFTSGVHYQYLDPEAGRARPMDTATLEQCARFLYQLQEEGICRGGTPGYPLDVAPALQLVTAYYIDCLYNPHPGSQGLALTHEAMETCIEMARAVGARHSFGTEPISPLRFEGGSVDLALDLYEPGMGVGVDPMPVLGVTAPMDWHAGWALSVAENLGSALLFQLCGLEEVWPSFRLFPPNLATGMTYFSSPKHLVALLTRRKVREFFGLGTDWGELLLVTAKAPGPQAAAEKMAGCVAGALHGFHLLEGAGALYLDVIFSPQQLLIDLELRDFVRSLMEEMPSAEADALEEVRRGVEAGSFLATDLSLTGFGHYMWRPRLFDLSTLGARARDLMERSARPPVAEKAAQYAYQLSGPRRNELERIMDRARRRLVR